MAFLSITKKAVSIYYNTITPGVEKKARHT